MKLSKSQLSQLNKELSKHVKVWKQFQFIDGEGLWLFIGIDNTGVREKIAGPYKTEQEAINACGKL